MPPAWPATSTIAPVAGARDRNDIGAVDRCGRPAGTPVAPVASEWEARREATSRHGRRVPGRGDAAEPHRRRNRGFVMATVRLETQVTHDCPACGGIMPADAIRISPWRLDTRGRFPLERRTVSMRCPHCGHVESRHETRPLVR